MNQSNYVLPALPEDYGYNKLLAVRALSIDYKHRDTELFLRSPDLLSTALIQLNTIGKDIKDLCKQRAMSLRYIYDIPRSVLDKEPAESARDIFKTMTNTDKTVRDLGNTYVDFGYIVHLVQNNIPINDNFIKNCIVISNKVSQRNMIQFFTKQFLPIPIMFISDFTFEKAVEEFNKALSIVILVVQPNNTTTMFNNSELKTLWALNHYLFGFNVPKYGTGGNLFLFRFKSDLQLPKAIKY